MSSPIVPYFEPNFMEYNAEDLCVGISLEVIYVSRELGTANSMSGSVNILTGKDNLLTTSYSDVSVLELVGGGNKESIGIESINIKYNSWYFPEVSIKFIDIRGNAVFNSMEKTNDVSTSGFAKGSFLKAFFMFPYPIFKLTVKGYFGEPVTYHLTVKGVPKAMFNSQTGNFEMNVEFIGHMYFGLTDIPMSLVMAAPYIDYGGKIELGNFKSGKYSGKKLPTYIDFISDVNKVLGETKKDEIITKLKSEQSDNNSKIETINACLLLLSSSDGDGGIKEYIEKFYKIEEKDGSKTLILDNDLYEKNKKEGDNKRSITNKLWEKIKGLKTELNKKFDIGLVIFENNLEEVPTNIDDKDNPIAFAFKYDYEGDKTQLENQKKSLETLNKDKQSEIEAKEREIRDKLPYTPTVKNFIEMTLGHLDVLRQITARCMDNIKKSTRSSKGIKLENTDCNVKGGEITMYPFTGYYNDKREALWIEDVKGASTFTEVSFITSIMTGVTNLTSAMAEVEKETELTANLVVSYPDCGIKTMLHDDWSTNVYKKKPEEMLGYCGDNSDTELPQVFADFAKRLIMANFLYGEDYANNFFSKVEALKLLHNGYSDEIFGSETMWQMADEQKDVEQFNKLITGLINDNVENVSEKEFLGFALEGFLMEKKIIDVSIRTITLGPKKIMWRDRKMSEYLLPNQNLQIIKSEALKDDTDKFNKVIDYITKNNITTNSIYNGFKSSSAQNFKSLFGIQEHNKFFKKKGENIIVTVGEGDYNFNNIDSWLTDDVEIDFKAVTLTYTKGEDYNKVIDWFTQSIWGRFIDFQVTLDFFNSGGIQKVPKIALISLYWILVSPLKYDNNANAWFGTYTSVAPYNGGDMLPTFKTCFIDNKLKEFYDENKNWAAENIIKFYKEGIEDDTERQNFINFLTTPVYLVFPYKRDAAVEYTTDMKQKDTVLTANRQESMSIDGYKNFLSTVRNYIITDKNKNDGNSTTSDSNATTASAIIADSETSKYRKLAIYEVFKQLYDRWKFGAEKYTNSKIKPVSINDFTFRDSMDRSIDTTLNENIEKVIKLLFSIYKGEVDMSIYEFLFELCNNSNSLLLSLPFDTFATIDSAAKLKNIFTPHPYSMVPKDEMHPTFVVTYRHKDSQNLDLSPDDSKYGDDGVDFLNARALPWIGNQKHGVFGVTYGLNNQSFFKDVQVSMDKPKVTEQSIASTLQIAQSGSKNSAASYGVSYHDLYDTYSNHSYQCTVTMMGNTQIAPMMYFQLNNIPLFKGGYYITNVEHNITKEGMKTTFTGTRLSRNQYKLFDAKFIKVPAGSGTPGGKGGKNGKQTTGSGQYGGVGGNYKARYAKGGLKYTKEDTVIIIVPQFIMTDKHRQSPDLNAEDFSTKVHSGFRGLLNENGKVEGNGILYPYSDTGKEVFKERAYWVNRKMALELETQLKNAGYQVDMNYYNKSINSKTGYNMPTNGVVKFNGKECTAIAIMLTVDALDKEVTNDAWLKTSDMFRTNIYYQPKNGIKVKKVTEVAMLPDISKKLAEAIKDRCNTGINTKIPKLEGKKHACQIKEMTASFGKIGYTYPPSVVIKHMSVNEIGHAQALALKSYREFIAKRYVQGIDKFFESVKDYVTDSTATEIMYNYDEKMSRYYTWREAVKNPTKNEEWKYIPTDSQHIADLKEIYNQILDKIVDEWKSKININSAYRNPKFNSTLKHASKTSQHCLGQALDISMYGSSNANLFQLIYNMMNDGTITLGQLIWEGDSYDKNGKHFPTWIHISLPKRKGQKNYVLHYDTVTEEWTGKGKWKPPAGISPVNPNPTLK